MLQKFEASSSPLQGPKKSWMDRGLFEDRVCEQDNKFEPSNFDLQVFDSMVTDGYSRGNRSLIK